jgi:hypothetical protein
MTRETRPAPGLRWTDVLWPGAVIAAVALVCWNQIARTLGGPIYTQLALGGDDRTLPRPGGGTAVVQSYQAATATVAATHISSQLQWMIASATVLQFLILAAAILTIQVVWVRTSKGRPFARSVTVSLVGLAILVALAGSANDILQSLIGEREAFEILGSGGSDYYSSEGFSFSGLPILVALGIALLASAFAIGAKLTKDTEGLV